MTIVAIHFTDKNIFCIADGLISKGGQGRVIEQDQKIQKFTPRYKIPTAALGHFNGFKEYQGPEFCIAYAGNYTLVSSIIKKFLDAVENNIVLDREKGTGVPKLYRRENMQSHFRSKSYMDSYNFNYDEIPHLTVTVLTNILQQISEKACTDFVTNAMLQPDAQFMIFGTDKVGHDDVHRCQILKCGPVAFGEFSFTRYSLLPSTLDCIGDAKEIPHLISRIENNPQYHTMPTLTEDGVKDVWLDDEDNAFTRSLKKQRAENKFTQQREKLIKFEVLTLIEKNLGTIGGDCTYANKGWATKLETHRIKSDAIQDELEDLA